MGRKRNISALFVLIISICFVVTYNAIPKSQCEITLENIESAQMRLTEKNTGIFMLYDSLNVEFYITYYDYCPICVGQYFVEGAQPLTASGTNAIPWKTIAVDPNVIPLGSRVRIEGFDDIVFIAQDTGGMVQGNHIDIFVNTHDECYEQTITKARVNILGPDESF